MEYQKSVTINIILSHKKIYDIIVLLYIDSYSIFSHVSFYEIFTYVLKIN